MNNPRIITIIGNVGSGKTTAMPILAKELDADILDADDLFQTKSPFREQFLKDLPRWALANELWLVVERVKLLKNFLKNSSKEVKMIDSGLLMSWVYAKSHIMTGKMTKEEWDLFEELFRQAESEVSKNNLVVYFNLSYETLMERIKQRGRDYELRQYSEYVKELQLGLDALEGHLKENSIPILKITEKEASDFKNNKAEQDEITRNIKEILSKID